MNAKELKYIIRNRLAKEAQNSASFEAEQFIIHFLGLKKEDILRGAEAEFTSELKKAVEERAAGKPLQYILGQWEFYGNKILCKEGVLIPRPETEFLVDVAVFHGGESILELCAGSGAAGINAAIKLKAKRAVFSDINDDALKLCGENAKMLGIAEKAEFLKADIFEADSYGKFDIILSNPPYINEKDMAQLPENVAKYEPHTALFGGEDGLDFYRRIAEIAPDNMNCGALLAVEVGYDQADAVCNMFAKSGLSDIRKVKDYSGIFRVVTAIYK